MFGIPYRSNPRDSIPVWAFEVAQLWHQCRGEFGLLHLPDAGGMGDQPAWTMDAFAICAAADAELRKAEQPDRGE